MLNGNTIKDENFNHVCEVKLDDRNRVALTKAIEVIRSLLGNTSLEELRFTIFCNSVGQLLLSPKASIPLDELWLHENKTAVASVRKGLKQAAQGEVRSLGSFAKFADDEID